MAREQVLGARLEQVETIGADGFFRAFVMYGPDGQRWRFPTVYRSGVVTAAGSTAVWTPAAGKRFVLLGYHLFLIGNSIQAAAGVITVNLQDAATLLGLSHSIYVPSAAANIFGGTPIATLEFPAGITSAANNNALNVNLSAALTAGGVRSVVWGVEE